MIAEYISSYVTESLIETSFIGIKNAAKRINKNQEIIKIERLKIDDSIEFIRDNLEENIKWATNIAFQGSKNKNINDIFVDIDLFVHPKKERISRDFKSATIPISNLLIHTERNIVLLGDPGAGKTTSVKKIFTEILMKDNEISKTFNIPIIIKLKELKIEEHDNELILFRKILSIFGVFLNIKKDNSSEEIILRHIFREFVERLNLLIILDGFDEISDPLIKEGLVKNLRILSNSLVSSRFILTSRSADYNVNIDNTEVFEISPLNEKQIEEFANKWLNSKKKGTSLLSKLKASPYWDTTIRPLLLAQMCALFERYGDIPEKPKSVYDKITTLLLEEWNVQNSVKRPSKYANFEVERKKEFLSAFAFELVVFKERFWFDRDLLKKIYHDICSDFDLPKNMSSKVINEIESHNGLIIQSGIDQFEFSHKSIAEYLVATHLVKLPSIIMDYKILLKIPNELAIMTSISSGPSYAYYHILFGILKDNIVNEMFLRSFLYRTMVEKPDFERSSPLYAITNLYLMNQISKETFIKDHRLEKSKQDERKKYYADCMEILTDHCIKQPFIDSCKQLLTFYYRYEKATNLDLISYDFDGWNDVYELKRSGTLNYLGINIDLPEKLYAPSIILG